MNLTDAQLALLCAASQREDLLLTRPGTAKGKAAETVIAGLLRKGPAQEVPVAQNQPHWCIDEEERPLGLKISAAGLAALGLSCEGEVPAALPAAQPHTFAIPASVPAFLPDRGWH